MQTELENLRRLIVDDSYTVDDLIVDTEINQATDRLVASVGLLIDLGRRLDRMVGEAKTIADADHIIDAVAEAGEELEAITTARG